MNQGYEFRKLDLAELKQMVHFALKEGWNSGPHDADIFYQTDSKGFYGYFFQDQLIGGGSIVSYNAEFGFMGFFIVKPEFRGKGLGRELWYLRRDTLISRLKPNAAIGMDGVVAMQDFYHKGGFEITFRDERYERRGDSFETDRSIAELNISHEEDVISMDLECFGFPRPSFLLPWLYMPQSQTFVYYEANELQGFAHIRKANIGFKIGPLFARNYEVAKALYKTCLNYGKGDPVFLDIPVSNQLAKDLVDTMEAKYTMECARMYYGQPPELPIDKIYGITSFELG